MALVLVIVTALPASALAAGENEGQVIFGGDYTLRDGETLTGDLVVLGGNVTLETGSVVDGSVFLMGGNAEMGGAVERDVALFGGNLTLSGTARIGGDVTVFGGNLRREEGAIVSGQVLSGDSVRVPFDWEFGRIVRIPSGPWSVQHWPVFEGMWFSGVSYVLRAVLLAGLAVLLVMFIPVQASRVGRTVVEQPVITGGLGILSAIVVPIFLVVLAATICLIPVTVVGAMLLVVAVVFGWIGLGLEVGQRLAQAFHWTLHPAAAAGLGTLVMTLVVDGIGFIQCVGWLAPALVGALGLGSVIVTRFGTQLYLPSAGSPGALTPPAPTPTA
ncbi:MAG: hypothetical protein A2Y93_12780 [Chloroflexi bacterium RBG_13_68_17]|nr:MAG: hypothetical protein A2Y93_12780 [Chloroflexi bacterium RBG_13_68_17]